MLSFKYADTSTLGRHEYRERLNGGCFCSSHNFLFFWGGEKNWIMMRISNSLSTRLIFNACYALTSMYL